MKRLALTRALTSLLPAALLGLLVSACGTGEALTQKTFTFKGELPADFAIKAQAHYDVVNNCSGSAQAKSFETEFKRDPQEYRFNIPVAYRSGLCEMQLARVGLYIHGRYGDKDWQQTYDNGGLVIVDKLPEGAPAFQYDDTLTKQAECTWWFQESKLYLEISKILNCKGAGAHLVRGELPGKTVQLDFRVNPEEEPSHDETWVKFPEGWKPCLPKQGWPNCQNPPVFKSFKMNGRECTVYPNCTE